MKRSHVLPLLAAAAGLAVGGIGSAALSQSAPSPRDRAAIERIVHDYILAHPEILPEAMARLQDREGARAIATERAALTTPFRGAWAGAETGDVTLVMFSDYACGYCRASVADVDRLLAEDKKLKVVWREIPILGPNSEAAARAALAAAGPADGKGGRYLDLHRRIFAGGSPTPAKLAAAETALGLDPAAIATAARAPAIDEEIRQNIALAQKLGVSGTPAFVVGDKVLGGAVGYEALKQAVAAARG